MLLEQLQFDADALPAAINLLSYGLVVRKHRKNRRKPLECPFYIFEEDPTYLQYLNPLKLYTRTRIALLEITEVRDSPTSEHFMHVTKNVLQVSYAAKKVVLEFRNENERSLFWQGLQWFVAQATGNHQEPKGKDLTSLLGTKMFLQGDTDGSRSLSYQEIRKIILQMHVSIPDDRLQHLFDHHDQDRSGTIDQQEFLKLLKQILTYDDLKPIYTKCASYTRNRTHFDDDEGLMTRHDFHHFITQVQHQNIPQIELGELFASYANESQHYYNQRLISFTAFTLYLLNPTTNSALDPASLALHHDMTRPLTDYYINSSHNTYLMSNQLTGESSVEAYINAFKKGCRCVELDCWDGPNGQPIIYHGYTMTSKITFESVVRTINEYAFKYTPYPLILSLEVHCQVEQQDVMADILNEHLDDMLLLLPEDWEQTQYYPSPEDLKFKIIIKHKGRLNMAFNYRLGLLKSKSISDADDMDSISMKSVEMPTKKYKTTSVHTTYHAKLSQFGDPQKEIDQINKRLFEQIHKSRGVQSILEQRTALTQVSAREADCNVEDEDDINMNQLRAVHSQFCPLTLKPKYRAQQLAINMIVSYPNPRVNLSPRESKFIQFDQNNKKDSAKLVSITTMFGISMNLHKPRSVWEISSLDENKIASFMKTNEKAIVDFHRQYFTRIYPAGARVDSSNYDPLVSFNAGSQVVALNFQTNDMPMLLNQCKFQENGGVGYLLKPEWMLSNAKKPMVPSDFKETLITLELHVICGQNLKSSNPRANHIIDPFVRISLRGAPQDEARNPQGKSVTIKDNGLNPKFDFKWKAYISCPDLAMIVFEVLDEDVMQNNFVAWNAVPLNCLRQGYRNLQLLGKQLQPVDGSILFLKISMN